MRAIVSHWGLLHWQPTALTGVAVLWAVVCLACCGRTYLQPTRQTVFHNYAKAGRAWLDGADAYDLDQSDRRVTPGMSGFRYAPVVSVLLAPFSLLSDRIAGVSWRVVGIACFLGFFAWHLRQGLPNGRALADQDQALLWLLLMPLSLVSINNGQANVLLMGLLVGAATAVVTERWNLAAGLLACACLLKLYPLAVALLLILIQPRRLAWRFVIAMLIGLAIPFLAQTPGYVCHQYHNWLTLLVLDDRRDFPLTQGYRDFYLLTRVVGVPLAPWAYLTVQLGAAAMVAGVGLLGRRRDWPMPYLAATLFSLGCAWMAVFGPSVESSTYILIAPALAWALFDAKRPTCPRWSRYALFIVAGLFLAAYVTAWFAQSRDWCYLAQPIAALIFFVERLVRSITAISGSVGQASGLPLEKLAGSKPAPRK